MPFPPSYSGQLFCHTQHCNHLSITMEETLLDLQFANKSSRSHLTKFIQILSSVSEFFLFFKIGCHQACSCLCLQSTGLKARATTPICNLLSWHSPFPRSFSPYLPSSSILKIILTRRPPPICLQQEGVQVTWVKCRRGQNGQSS